MSYNKTTWQTGDKITAAKMNKIEDGIAAAEQSGGGANVMIVNVTITNSSTNNLKGSYIDKTFGEVFTALDSGTLVYLKITYGTDAEQYVARRTLTPVVCAYKYDECYRIMASYVQAQYINQSGDGVSSNTGLPASIVYTADDPSDYPVFAGIRYVGSGYTSYTNTIS